MLRGTCWATTSVLCHCKHAARRPMLVQPPLPCSPYRMKRAEPKERLRQLELLACSSSAAVVLVEDDHRCVRENCSSFRRRGWPSSREPTVPVERGHARQQPRSGRGLPAPPPLRRGSFDDGCQMASNGLKTSFQVAHLDIGTCSRQHDRRHIDRAAKLS
jgi:hypothetical protein